MPTPLSFVPVDFGPEDDITTFPAGLLASLSMAGSVEAEQELDRRAREGITA